MLSCGLTDLRTCGSAAFWILSIRCCCFRPLAAYVLHRRCPVVLHSGRVFACRLLAYRLENWLATWALCIVEPCLVQANDALGSYLDCLALLRLSNWSRSSTSSRSSRYLSYSSFYQKHAPPSHLEHTPSSYNPAIRPINRNPLLKGTGISAHISLVPSSLHPHLYFFLCPLMSYT